MDRRLIYVVLGLIGVPVVFFAIIAGIVYVNSDEIKARIITELNNSTGMSIRIQGKVELAFFKHFPNVALELQGVEVNGIDTVNTPFIKAGKVYLLANFWDVVQSNWNIKSTSIENGEVTMLHMKNGATNYKFNKSETKAEASSSVLNIERALLKNIKFRLNDELNEVSIHIQVDDASVKGNFSARNLALTSIGNVYSHQIEIKHIDYAREKEISFEGDLSVIPENENYMLAIKRFLVENNEFEINGSIVVKENAPEFDLAVRGNDISIKDLPMLLPEQYSSKLSGIKGTGKVQVSSEIKGRLDEKSSPLVTITANCSGAVLQIPGMDSKVEGLSFKGTFTNGTKHSLATSTITLSNLNARTKYGVLDADFSLVNFDEPELNANAQGMIDLSMFNRFLPDSSSVRDLKGTLEFENLKYHGRADHLASGKLYGMQGSVSLRNVAVRIDTMKVLIAGAHIEAYEKSLSIGKLEVELPGSKFSVTGKVIHMPGLSKTYDVPVADLTVKAERVDMENILALSNGNVSVPDEKQKVNQSFGINGFIRLNSGYIGWDQFKAYDASCILVFDNNIAEIKDFSCNTMDGMLDFESKIVKYGNGMTTSTKVNGSNLNITELFYQLGNFRQNAISSNNVAGKLEFKADIKADFVKGQLDEKSLTASSKLTIVEGQLIDLNSLDRLSKFIDIEELRNIKFSTMSNTVSISQGVVDIPEMMVKSNALNLSVSGQQTFAGDIDYHIKVNIFDILGKKFRKKKNVSDYEEIGENDFNFYLTMTGTVDEPIIKHEKQGVKNRFVEQKKDFRLIGKDEHEVTNDALNTEKGKTIFTNKKKQQEPVEDELEFIEWEEE